MNDAERVIAVAGEGSALGVPDRCLISLVVTAMRDSASDAIAAVAQLADAVVGAVHRSGVPTENVRTQSLAVQDWFDQAQGRVTARVGTYGVLVSDRRIDEVSGLLNAVVVAGGDAVTIQGIRLSVSDTAPLHAAARRDAVQDARIKAEQLAKASGVRLGPVLAVEEGLDGGGQPFAPAVVARRHAASAAAAPMPIEPGSQAVRVRVVMTFAIAAD